MPCQIQATDTKILYATNASQTTVSLFHALLCTFFSKRHLIPRAHTRYGAIMTRRERATPIHNIPTERVEGNKIKSKCLAPL